jgi:hypothetical protein
MESLYARMSQEQPRVMVVGNGGIFSIMEINESLQHDFELFLVQETGRFADVAAVLLNKKIDESVLSMTSEQIIEHVKAHLPPEVSQEFLQKDFGTTIESTNDDHKVYREFFTRFLQLAAEHRDRIHLTTLANLESDLEQHLGNDIE